nr:MAG TPA: hypothetical protein [Caudoviricetes sp.]
MALRLRHGYHVRLIGGAVFGSHLDSQRVGASLPSHGPSVDDGSSGLIAGALVGDLDSSIGIGGNRHNRICSIGGGRSVPVQLGRGKSGRQGQAADPQVCQIIHVGSGGGVYLLHLPHSGLDGRDVQDEESVVVHGEAVGVPLDEIHPLILDEVVMVAVLNAAIPSGANSGKILVPQAHDRLSLLHSGRLDYGHGIRHHVIGVSAARGHHSGGGHDLLEVIHGIDHQDHVTHIPCLSVGVHRHEGKQITHSRGRQVGHGHRSLDGVHAAGHSHVVADLAIHADGHLVAVASHNAGLQTVGIRLVQNLPHKAIQPFRAQIQHGLADRHKGGQLEQAGVNLLETRGQLPDDLITQLAPGSFLVAVGVHHHPDRAPGVGELDMGQQRVGSLEFIEHCVDDGLRHHHIQVIQSLAGILFLHRADEFLIEDLLLAGELAHAAGGQYRGVNPLLHLLHLLGGSLLHIVADVLNHLVKGDREFIGVAIFDGLLNFGPDLIPGQSVVVSHLESILLSVVEKFHDGVDRNGRFFHGFPLRFLLRWCLRKHSLDNPSLGCLDHRSRRIRCDGRGEAVLQRLCRRQPRLRLHQLTNGISVHTSPLDECIDSNVGHEIRLIRRSTQVFGVALGTHHHLVEVVGGQVGRDSLIASQERIEGRAGNESISVCHNLSLVLPKRVVNRPTFRNGSTVAVDVNADFVNLERLDLATDSVCRYISIKKLEWYDVAENVDIRRSIGLLDCIVISHVVSLPSRAQVSGGLSHGGDVQGHKVFIAPRLCNRGLVGRPQHVVDCECARANQLFHVGCVGENIEVNDAGGINPQEVPTAPTFIPVPLPVDFLLELVRERVDAVCEEACVGIRRPLDRAVDQHGRDQESPRSKVEDVLYHGSDIPCVPAGPRSPADVFVGVSVELWQDSSVAFQKRLNLGGDPLLKLLRPPFVALSDLVHMNLPVLAVPPGVRLHRRGHHPPIGLVQTIQDRLHVCLVQLQVDDAVFIERILKLVLIHCDAAILVLPGWPQYRRFPGVRHHKRIKVTALHRVYHQGFVILVQPGDQLVQERAGVLVRVRGYVPQVVLSPLYLFVGLEGAKLAPPQCIGDHVHANPEGQFAHLVFLRGFKQFAAGHLHRVGLTSFPKPSKEIDSHQFASFRFYLKEKSQPPISRQLAQWLNAF